MDELTTCNQWRKLGVFLVVMKSGGLRRYGVVPTARNLMVASMGTGETYYTANGQLQLPITIIHSKTLQVSVTTGSGYP